MVARPEVLYVFCSLFAAFELNMPLMLCLASLAEGVLRGTRANAPAALATLFPAKASHRCVSPRRPFFIPPASNQ
jgi:hypothetical protein